MSNNVNEGSWRYPGWRVVMLAAAGMVATLPGRTVGLGLITEPLLADLELSRTSYATSTFWATLIGAFFSLLAGRAIDRFGAKAVLLLAVLLLAVNTVCFGHFVAIGNLTAFLILSRGLGQSALSTVSVTSVGKWFTNRLGIALGVFSALVAFGFAAVIPTLGAMITEETWRGCWTMVGYTLAGLALTIAVVMPRQRSAVQSKDEDHELSTDWRTALRTRAFWIFTLATAVYYLVLSGLTLFAEDVLVELGFDHKTFIVAMAAMMGAGLIGNFAAGWMCVRYQVTRLVAFSLLLLAGVLVGFSYLTSTMSVVVLFAAYGVCGGAFAVLFFAGFAQAFGKADLGRIQGAAQVCGVICSAVGPVILAQTKLTGSYLPAFNAIAPVAFVLAIVAWLTKMPALATSDST